MDQPHSDRQKHVAVIGFPGYGHFIPLITLAEKLAPHHHVTLAVSQSILPNLRKRGLITAVYEQNVKIIGIEDGVPEGLGEDTVPNNWDYMYDHILPSIAKFIQNLPTRFDTGNFGGRPVDIVIGDPFVATGLSACAGKNIPYYLFCTCSAGPFRKLIYITDDTLVDADAPMALDIRPASEGPQPVVRPGTKRLALAINQHLSAAKGMVLNSFRDLEAPFLEEYCRDPRMSHYDFWCIGPLMPDEKPGSGEVHDQIKKWLDTKNSRSVLYVSFGTVDMPDDKRIVELGKALHATGRPFVFSLRSQQLALLPQSLQDMTSESILPGQLGIILPWIPQKAVLAHPSVGAFISHCGWNSSMEALWYGKPVIGWPIHGDQFTNANWLREIGMGMVPPGAEDDKNGLLGAELIQQAVEEVMEPMGSFTVAAGSWSEKAKAATEKDGASYNEFVDLIKFD